MVDWLLCFSHDCMFMVKEVQTVVLIQYYAYTRIWVILYPLNIKCILPTNGQHYLLLLLNYWGLSVHVMRTQDEMA